MLGPASRSFIDLPTDTRPILIVVVDTEEEFDWAQPVSRDNRSVRSISSQPRAHEIFDGFGIVPTYVIDHPVVSDRQAVAVLRSLLAGGSCEIGAHLHPWVNPPFDEVVTAVNSYPGNLPADLERAKLAQLTAAIAEGFGRSPTIYKAGRYGLGPQTAEALLELGYQIDVSVVPFTSFADDGGPDFSSFGIRPYWHGGGRPLLEIPLTCGFCGLLRGIAPRLFPYFVGPLGMSLHVPGVFARSGLIERIRLTPEGTTSADLRRVTRSLLEQGVRLFSYSYHSPSLAPGHTPYVRDRTDLDNFLRAMADYFGFFMEELGGRAMAVSEFAGFARSIQAPPKPTETGAGQP